MLYYVFRMATGEFEGVSPDVIGAAFNSMRANPVTQVGWMFIAVLLGFGVCALGLQKGVERITKVIMSSLFIIMLVLCVRSVTLPGAGEGLRFYLVPDFGRMVENGLGDAIFAAMGQAFFTLSLGVGSMAIFGSYIGRERSLTWPKVYAYACSTTPCGAYGGADNIPGMLCIRRKSGSGPGAGVRDDTQHIQPDVKRPVVGHAVLHIHELCSAFNGHSCVENIISFGMDLWGWTRRKAVAVNVVLVFVLSLPCALGFNLFSGLQSVWTWHLHTGSGGLHSVQ